MKNKENIIIVKQRTWYFYAFYIIFIGIDFFENFQLFEDISRYYPLLYCFIILFFYFSFSVKKITLNHELLIFDYYFWFKWRKRTFKINEIKSFYFQSQRGGISIEISLHNSVKSASFFLLGFREKSISNLYYELDNHPLNKLESCIE
jgi:hypothetical protein